MRDVAGYAVEFDPMEAAEFRRSVESIAGQWREADSLEKMRTIQSSLTSGMRIYRDRSAARFDRLRKDLAASIKALEAFTGSTHEVTLEITVGKLHRASEDEPSAFAKKVVQLSAALEQN